MAYFAHVGSQFGLTSKLTKWMCPPVPLRWPLGVARKIVLRDSLPYGPMAEW